MPLAQVPTPGEIMLKTSWEHVTRLSPKRATSSRIIATSISVSLVWTLRSSS
jgi:hypothetical protein